MDRRRLTRPIRLVLGAAGIVAGAGALWLVAILTNTFEVPGCGPDESGCGFAVLSRLLVAAVLFVVVGAATWVIVKVEHVYARTAVRRNALRRLTLRERTDLWTATPADFAVEVRYHDDTGRSLGGVQITYAVKSRGAGQVITGGTSVVTDSSGVAMIPVHVSGTPCIVSLDASVPGDPTVAGVHGDFLVGVGWKTWG